LQNFGVTLFKYRNQTPLPRQRLSSTNIYTGLHIAAAGLKSGGLSKIIFNQPSAWQPVKLVLRLQTNIKHKTYGI
jgi:hypothetical protein